MLNAVFLKKDRSLLSEEESLLRSFLPEATLQRIDLLSDPEEKELRTLAQVLIRMEACRLLGAKNRDLVFSSGVHGKPCLTAPSGFEFSLSHSHGRILLAFGTVPVGADAELLRHIRAGVIRRCYLEHESEYVTARTKDLDLRAVEVWTKKEAYAKLTGEGMANTMQKADVLSPGFPAHFTCFLEEKMLMTICTHAPADISLLRLTTDELIKNAPQLLL